MKITKEYLANNLGLKNMTGLNGEKIYPYIDEGFFGRISDTNIWCFIPYNNPKVITTIDEFEKKYR